jgi:ribosomal protein L17
MYFLTHSITRQRLFVVGIASVPSGNRNHSQRDKDGWLRQLGFSLIVRERIETFVKGASNVPRIMENVHGGNK